MPKRLFRLLRGGPNDGHRYEVEVMPGTMDPGYLRVKTTERTGAEYTSVYRFVDKQIEGEGETHVYDFVATMGHDEALDYVLRDSAHNRN